MRWRCHRYRRTSSGFGHGMENDDICGALSPAAASGTGADLGLERLHRGEGKTHCSVPAPAATHAPAGTGRRQARRGGRSDRSCRPSRAGPGTHPARTTTSPRRQPARGASSAPRASPTRTRFRAARTPTCQVAGVDIASDRREVEVDLARAVRAVDDRECAVLAGEGAQPGDRQDEGAQRRDVAHEKNARARREPRRNRVEQIVLALRGPRQRCDNDLRARERRDLVPQDPLRAVLVVRDEDLVTAAQPDASRDRIEPGRHVRDEPMSSPDAARTNRATLCRTRASRAGSLRARNSTGSSSSSRRSSFCASKTGRGKAPKLPWLR